MFEKFGEFDSYEEINRAAAAQLAEGDTEAIYAIERMQKNTSMVMRRSL